MQERDFTPQKTKSFECVSGRLLIADLHYLGYSQEEYRRISSASKECLTYLKQGVLLRDYENDLWKVYRDNSGLLLIKDITDKIQKEAERSAEKSGLVGQAFQNASDQKMKEKGFLLHVPLDFSLLLIGDAENYTLPKNERVVSLDPVIERNYPKQVESCKQDALALSDTTCAQVVSLPAGRYACKRGYHRLWISPATPPQ